MKCKSAPGSNVSLAKWGDKYMREKVVSQMDMCMLATHKEVCLLKNISL